MSHQSQSAVNKKDFQLLLSAKSSNTTTNVAPPSSTTKPMKSRHDELVQLLAVEPEQPGPTRRHHCVAACRTSARWQTPAAARRQPRRAWPAAPPRPAARAEGHAEARAGPRGASKRIKFHGRALPFVGTCVSALQAYKVKYKGVSRLAQVALLLLSPQIRSSMKALFDKQTDRQTE